MNDLNAWDDELDDEWDDASDDEFEDALDEPAGEGDQAGWAHFLTLLDRFPWTLRRRVYRSAIFDPAPELRAELAQFAWFSRRGYRAAPPPGVDSFMLVRMSWYDDGPARDTFHCVTVGDAAAYVIRTVEEGTVVSIVWAKITPAGSATAFRALYLDAMAQLVPELALSDEIELGRPTLLNQTTIFDAYEQTLNRGELWEEFWRAIGSPTLSVWRTKRGQPPILKFEHAPLNRRTPPTPPVFTEEIKRGLLGHYLTVTERRTGARK